MKEYRVNEIKKFAKESKCKWKNIVGDLSDISLIDNIIAEYHHDIVVNLAAQSGVCYSITNPDA